MSGAQARLGAGTGAKARPGTLSRIAAALRRGIARKWPACRSCAHFDGGLCRYRSEWRDIYHPDEPTVIALAAIERGLGRCGPAGKFWKTKETQ